MINNIGKHFKGAPQSIKLAENNGSIVIPEKVQLLRCGKFNHPEYGTFEITKEILLSMKANFENKVRGIDLAIDYAHESQSIAASWIKDLELSEDGTELWAHVEWTPNGKRVLSDKEFRYLSADFTFNFENNETKKKYGPTLFGAGLTNRPVIKDMAPVVQLQETQNGGSTMDEKDKKIAELMAQIEELKKAKGAADEGAMMADMKKQLEESQAKCAEYEAASKKAAEEKALAEKTAKFELLLSEKKVVPAQKEAFMSGDVMKFSELAQPIKLDESGHGNSDTGTGAAGKEKTKSEQTLELANALVAKGGITLSDAILKVRKDNPKLVE